jgi:hypothetical protein
MVDLLNEVSDATDEIWEDVVLRAFLSVSCSCASSPCALISERKEEDMTAVEVGSSKLEEE